MSLIRMAFRRSSRTYKYKTPACLSYRPSLSASYKTQSRERRSITCFSIHPFIYFQDTNSFKFLQNRKYKKFVVVLPGSIVKYNCLSFSQIILKIKKATMFSHCSLNLLKNILYYTDTDWTIFLLNK